MISFLFSYEYIPFTLILIAVFFIAGILTIGANLPERKNNFDQET